MSQIHQRHPEIPLGTIRTTIRREKDRDDNKTALRSGRPRKISEEQLERLRELSTSSPGMTYKELTKEIGADISKKTLKRALQGLRKQEKGRQVQKPESKSGSKPESKAEGE